jgi:hypothetical protein
MSVPEALATEVDDTVESSALVPHSGFHPSPDAESAETTAQEGQRYAGHRGWLRHDQRAPAWQCRLDTRDRVTIDSVRPMPPSIFRCRASQSYIPHRRTPGTENRVDFVEGATALTVGKRRGRDEQSVCAQDDGTSQQRPAASRSCSPSSTTVRDTNVRTEGGAGPIGQAVRALFRNQCGRRSWKAEELEQIRGARRRHGLTPVAVASQIAWRNLTQNGEWWRIRHINEKSLDRLSIRRA